MPLRDVDNQGPFGGQDDVPCSIWRDKDLQGAAKDDEFVSNSLLSAQRMLDLEEKQKNAILSMSS
jgi:hypothetical protein